MPKTKCGRMALWLLVGFALLLGVFQLAVASRQRGGEEYFDNLWLAVPITLAGLSGTGAFFAGGFCLVKNIERSPLVWLATAVGLVVLVFVLGEIFGSH